MVWIGARPLGLLAQRALTVSTRFATACVRRVAGVVHPTGSTITFVVHLDVQLPP